MAGINTSIGGFDIEQVSELPDIERNHTPRGPAANSSVELLGFLKAFPGQLFKVTNGPRPNMDLDGMKVVQRNRDYYVSYEPVDDDSVGDGSDEDPDEITLEEATTEEATIDDTDQ